MEKSYKEYLKHITTFIFDVDGVLTDGRVTIDGNGELLRTMNVKDGYALKTALLQGFNICIISGGTNTGVKDRLSALGIDSIFLGAHHKLAPFHQYIEKHQIKKENILYMGDDIPDIPVMKEVGLPTCPQNAVAEVREIASYISFKEGGDGCVRDVIEQVLKVQQKWMRDFDARNV